VEPGQGAFYTSLTTITIVTMIIVVVTITKSITKHGTPPCRGSLEMDDEEASLVECSCSCSCMECAERNNAWNNIEYGLSQGKVGGIG
jgi:hypothetical protein